VWICNGSTWLCDHAKEFRAVFHDVPIVDQEVYDTQRGWIQRYREPGIQSFDRFIAVNRPIQAKFVGEFGMDPERVDLIYPTLDDERFRWTAATDEERRQRLREFDLPDGRRLFGFVGRLTGQKRPLDFLELARREQAANASDVFVMVGDGELRDDVERFIAEHRLSNVRRIPFCGAMERLLPLLSGIVIPSEFEGLPIAMLEALCMGVPALGTDVGDIRCVLERFGAGHVMATIGDADALHREFQIWREHLAAYRVAESSPAIREMFASRNIARQYQDCWRRAMTKRWTPHAPHFQTRQTACRGTTLGDIQS
jgi:glycosyltransferase involved in cell wall biosynthesis